LSHDHCSWILPCFRRSNENIGNRNTTWPCNRDTPLSMVRSHEAPSVNIPDLVRFLECVESWTDEVIESEGPQYMLETQNSVGFAYRGFREGDEVFAIDGAKKPFILRTTGEKRYRIVGTCYLWGALELDFWNPGSKVGRWGTERPPDVREQTQMIEIH
jgi:hypothetical protein